MLPVWLGALSFIVKVVAAQENAVHVYMLAFMNITRDRQDLTHLDEIFINAFDDNTAFTIKSLSTDVNPQKGFVPRDMTSQNYVFEFDGHFQLEISEKYGMRFTGLSVVTDKKSSVQASKSVDASTDGFFALPLTNTSTEFFLISYDFIPEGHSNFAIAAHEDDTCIEVFLVNGTTENRVNFIALDTYQVFDSASDMEDFTGYYVKSSKPVSVYAGHECARVPVDVNFCDFMQSQMPPLDEWGTYHITPPIIGRSAAAGYTLRVVASIDDTVVSLNGAVQGTIKRGVGFLEMSVGNTAAFSIVECSEPCLVVQYNRGYRAVDSDVLTDTFMMNIPSTRSYDTEIRFSTSNFIVGNTVYPFTNYLSLLVPTASKDQVRHNGAVIDAGSFSRVNDDYSLATLAIAEGSHNVQTTSGNAAMMGFVYGHGVTQITAYGYPVVFKMNGHLLTTEQAEDLPAQPTSPPKCANPFSPSRASSGDLTFNIYLEMTLETPLPSGCADLGIEAIRSVLPDVANYTNWLICTNVLCNQGSVDTWVYDVTVADSVYENSFLTKVQFLVRVWSSEEEVNLYRLACAYQIEYFLSNFYDDLNRWILPISYSSGCPAVNYVHPGRTVEVIDSGSRCMDI